MAVITGESFSLNVPKFCSCTFSKDNVYDYPELKEMLPVDYNYTVCSWFQENEKDFECKFRTNVSSKSGALAWLEAFKRSSNTYYTTDKTFAEDTQNLVYKVVMKCYRNTRPKYNTKQAHPQHTNCQARLTITVKKAKKPRRSKDVHLKDFPMVVLYHHRHNHDSNPVKALQKHSTNPEVTDTFIEYFKEGLTPSQAIERYAIHLKGKYGDEYHKALEDERLFPPKHSVYHLYTKAYKKGYVNSKRHQMFQSLISHINKFNTELKGRYSELKIFKDENFVLVIVSPLMQRVLLNIPETSDALYMDSLDNADNCGSKVFVFLTKSCYGVLPVGSVIVSLCREDILSCGIDQFKTFLKGNSFEGRGLLGPKVFLVEDNALIKSCISKAFPSATVILNTHLLLKDMWKYLINENIPLKRLQELLSKMKEMCYCDSEEQLNFIYNRLRSSPLATEFPNYILCIENLYARKEEWAKCFRHTLFIKEEYVNDLSMQTIDVFEDDILQMKKVFGVENLFDYIVSDLDEFYRNKLLFIIDGQSKSNQTKKTLIDVNNYKECQLPAYGKKSFAVRSFKGKRRYFVELDIGVCNCRIGKNGANCEHQAFVSNKSLKNTFPAKSIDLEEKAVLHYIATGRIDILNSYLAMLCSKTNVESLDKASKVIILEQNTSAVLEYEEHFSNTGETFDSETVNENLVSKQEDKFETLKQFQKCMGLIAKQTEDISVPLTLLAAKQFVNNFKKLAQNSVILPINCFSNNTTNSDCHSTAAVQHTDSTNTESVVHSNSSNKRRLIEGNNQNENPLSTLKPNKKLRSIKPHIVHISEKDVMS